MYTGALRIHIKHRRNTRWFKGILFSSRFHARRKIQFKKTNAIHPGSANHSRFPRYRQYSRRPPSPPHRRPRPDILFPDKAITFRPVYHDVRTHSYTLLLSFEWFRQTHVRAYITRPTRKRLYFAARFARIFHFPPCHRARFRCFRLRRFRR